ERTRPARDGGHGGGARTAASAVGRELPPPRLPAAGASDLRGAAAGRHHHASRRELRSAAAPARHDRTARAHGAARGPAAQGPAPGAMRAAPGARLDWRCRASGPLRGALRVPGDKSITHRALILGALARGTSEITGALDAEDCRATAAALRALGARI